MTTYHTVDGQSYSVTADGSEVTVSNASGLNQTVKAGTQYSFLGDGGDVTVDGPHHFTQLKGPFGNGGGGGGQKITVDDYLDHTYTSINPVQNRVLSYAIDSKQDKLTIDPAPVAGSTNPVSSGGMYPTPVLVVQGGIAQFPSRLRDNGIYVLWDNDLADRSAEIVIDPDTRPNEYSTAEIHIFNHTDTPVSIKWPASWHWRTPEGDYELDTEASQHVPVLKGNSCMCITVRCSVDRGTHFMPPPMTIVPFVMAEKAYEYTLSENTQQEG